MEQERSSTAVEPTIPRAIWSHRWMVLGAVIAGCYLGAMVTVLQPDRWKATASLVVEDPRASALFELGSEQRPERYAENQVEILRSPVVAQRAAELLAGSFPDADLNTEAVEDARSIDGQLDSDLVEITFAANDPDLAMGGADALTAAYQEVSRTEAARSYAFALQQLEDSIAAGQQEVANIQSSITELGGDDARAELEALFESSLGDLADLQSRLLAGELDEDILGELSRLERQFSTLQLVVGIESQLPTIGALLEEQSEAIRRLSDLIARRDQLTVDSEIAGSGVVFLSPALEAEPAGIRLWQAVLIGGMAGGLIGATVAFGLTLRRRRFFGSRAEPEQTLEAPLVAAVPDFDMEGLPGEIPVVQAPASAAAEAFRFAAATLNIPTVNGRELVIGGTGSIAVVSADPGDGRSVVAANIALAAAREGKRVLVVDADFQDQRVVQLLAPRSAGGPGLTDVVFGDAAIDEAARPLRLQDDTVIRVLGRGRLPVAPNEFFHSPGVARCFAELQASFDLVVIDAAAAPCGLRRRPAALRRPGPGRRVPRQPGGFPGGSQRSGTPVRRNDRRVRLQPEPGTP